MMRGSRGGGRRGRNRGGQRAHAVGGIGGRHGRHRGGPQNSCGGVGGGAARQAEGRTAELMRWGG